MFRRYLFGFVALAALFVSTAVLGTAQSGQLRGHVVMKQADGTQVPASWRADRRFPNRHCRQVRDKDGQER